MADGARSWVYNDPEERIYHDHGLLKQGDRVLAVDAPDHRFVREDVPEDIPLLTEPEGSAATSSEA